MPIRELYNGEADGKPAAIDIVAVHGLNPWNKPDHAYATWQKPDGKDGHLWLRDSFKTEQPNARTALYEYNSSPVFQTDGRDRFIYEANDFLEAVKIWRTKKPSRPLILIGHSLGGILIRQALTHAKDNERYSLIKDNTYALVFFGTPNAGHTKSAKTAFGQAYTKVIKAYSGNSSDDLLQALDKHSIFTDNLTERWRHQIDLYKFVFFWSATDEFVPRDSAVMELPGGRSSTPKLSGDHSDICRFDLRDATDRTTQVDRDNYIIVEGNLVELCQGALAKVEEELAEEANPKEGILCSLRHEAANPRWGNISQPYEGMSVWIWKDRTESGPGFVEWLGGPAGVFWITGKPGAGKSTLMKYIYNSARTTQLLPNGIHQSRILKVSYFFHDQGTSSEKTWSGLLHAFLRQLLLGIKTVPSEIKLWYDGLRENPISIEGEFKWSEDNLWWAIRLLLSHQEDFNAVLIFIDALDEYEGRDYGSRLEGLMSLIGPALGSSCVVKICIASRPLNAITVRQTPASHGLKIHEWTNDDISKYVAARLNGLLVLPGLHQFRTKDPAKKMVGDFTELIIKRAFGVFIWVTLAVNNLLCGVEAGDTHAELLSELEQLPSELEALYDDIFQKIKLSRRDYLPETINYLRIVMMSKHRRTYEPFTVLKLALASEGVEKAIQSPVCTMDATEKIGIAQSMKQRLASRCRGLLDTTTHIQGAGDPSYPSSTMDNCENTDDEEIQLIHLTLFEYLSRRLPDIMTSINTELIKDPDVCLMGLGLRYLKSETVTDQNSLLHQAVIGHCLVHANRAEVSTGHAQTKFLDLLNKLLEKKYPVGFLNCLFLYKHVEPLPRDTTHDGYGFMHLAMVYSLVYYVAEKIRESFISQCGPKRPYLAYPTKPRGPYISSRKHQDIDHTIKPGDRDLLLISTILDNYTLDQETLLLTPACPYCGNQDPRAITVWEALLLDLWDTHYAPSPQAASELRVILLRCIVSGADPNLYLKGRWRCDSHWEMNYIGTPFHLMIRLWGQWFKSSLDPSAKHYLWEFIHHGADPEIEDATGQSVLDMSEWYDPTLSMKNFLLEERKKYLEQQASNSRTPASGDALAIRSKAETASSPSASTATRRVNPPSKIPKPIRRT
ncbi:MAG: hypothetical protein M1836_005706 [Candelina mexicana]|nr:MAG: hypothetical protein M1836_005706 [Candelina mexicana]